jgi:hypothetical protein
MHLPASRHPRFCAVSIAWSVLGLMHHTPARLPLPLLLGFNSSAILGLVHRPPARRHCCARFYLHVDLYTSTYCTV